jgi:hypothetical protein
LALHRTTDAEQLLKAVLRNGFRNIIQRMREGRFRRPPRL